MDKFGNLSPAHSVLLRNRNLKGAANPQRSILEGEDQEPSITSVGHAGEENVRTIGHERQKNATLLS